MRWPACWVNSLQRVIPSGLVLPGYLRPRCKADLDSDPLLDMSHKLISLLLTLLLSALVATASPTHAAEPYTVKVWASVLFDTEGKSTEFRVVDEETLPAPFLKGVKQRLAQARIKPQLDGTEPASFRTGVRLDFLITPTDSGGTVTVKGLTIDPLPIKKYFASYPDDVARTGGWEGGVNATCTVGTDGTCIAVDVKALPGMPDSLRRFAIASFKQWQFEPQQLNGRPVEGQYTLQLTLQTEDTMPDDFRRPKSDHSLQRR